MFSFFKSEIRRMYKEFVGKGMFTEDVIFNMNVSSIISWKNCEFITEEEAHKLRKYNRTLYSSYL